MAKVIFFKSDGVWYVLKAVDGSDEYRLEMEGATAEDVLRYLEQQ